VAHGQVFQSADAIHRSDPEVELIARPRMAAHAAEDRDEGAVGEKEAHAINFVRR
jgi:hypothetical protein